MRQERSFGLFYVIFRLKAPSGVFWLGLGVEGVCFRAVTPGTHMNLLYLGPGKLRVASPPNISCRRAPYFYRQALIEYTQHPPLLKPWIRPCEALFYIYIYFRRCYQTSP